MSKKRKNYKRGFTLVELLVTIVVLGIITAMALPLVRKLKYDQDQKKYTTYMQSMEYSAKLYVDSYGDDIFQNKETSCQEITYSQLKERKLIKDISVEDISCANDNSKVYVKKNGNDYDYYVVANCNGKEYTYGNKNVAIGCEPPTATFGYNASPPSYTKLDKKQLSINLQITSSRGFNPYTDVDYYFVDNKGNKVTESKKLTIDIPSEESQKPEVQEGHTITAKANVVTPETLSGSGYKLVIVTNRLLTLEGEKDSSLVNNTKDFGPYTFDNTPPNIKPLLETTIKDSDPKYIYNVLDPVFTIDVTDNLVKTRSDFRICVSLDQDTCAKDAESIKNYQPLSGNNSYFGSASSKTIHVSDNYDSSKHKLYVTVVDLAGNITSKVVDYQVGQKYTIKYNANATTPKVDLSRSEDYIILNQGVERTWGQLTSPNKGSILQPTRDYYKFTGWNTKANGSGETITASTKATKDLVVYAQWTPINYSITYDLAGGTVNGTNPTSFNYETATFTVINPTRTGYNFTGWTGTGLSEKTMTLKISAGSHDNRSYKANWEPIKYTVEYYNGTTKLGSSTHTYDQAKKLTAIKSLGSESGYDFYGWTARDKKTDLARKYGNEESVKNLTTKDKDVIKIYAIWQRQINFYSGIAKATNNPVPEYYNKNSSTYSLQIPTPKSITYWNTPLGWRDDTSAGSKEYSSGTTKTTKSTTTSYYAVYSRTVTIAYNSNGGSGSVTPQTSTQYYNSNGSITSIPAVSLRSNSFTKKGYEFSKWAAGSTSGTQYSAGASYTFSPAVDASATKTMYAIWKSARYMIENSGQSPIYRDYLKDAVAAATSGAKITLLSSFKDQPAGVKVNKSINLIIPENVTLTLDYNFANKEEGIVSSVYTTGSATMNISGGGTIIGSPTESSYMFRAMDTSTMKFDNITVGVNGLSAEVANVIWVNTNATLTINNSHIYQKNLLGGVVKISSNKTTTITDSWIYKAGRTNVIVVDGSSSGSIKITGSHLGMASSGSTGADSVITIKSSSNVKMDLSSTNVMHGSSGPNAAIDIYADAYSTTVNVSSGSNIYNLGSTSTDPPNVVAVRDSNSRVNLNGGGKYFSVNGALISSNYVSRVNFTSGSAAAGDTCGTTSICGTQSGSVSKTFKYMDNYNSEQTKDVSKNYYVKTK